MTSDLTSDKVTVSAHVENVANTSEVAACWGEVYGGAGGGPVPILLLSRGSGGGSQGKAGKMQPAGWGG